MRKLSLSYIYMASLIFVCLGLVYFLVRSQIEKSTLIDNYNQLQSSQANNPQVIKVDSIVYEDRIYNVYKVPKLSQNDENGKIAAAGGREKLDSLTRALGIKTKDLLTYKEINASLSVENQKLKQKPTDPSKFSYRDESFNLVIDKDKDMVDSLGVKVGLVSSSYLKAPKWYKSKEESFTLSASDKRIELDLKGFDLKPKVTKSMVYADTRYIFNPKTLGNGSLISTLNYEGGMDNIFSWYVGGGVQTDFRSKPVPVVNIGTRLRIAKFKK